MMLLWILLFLASLLYGSWLFTIMITTWFCYWYPAWWLFLVVVLVDAYYGGFTTLPVLSLVFGGFVLLVETLKMQLLGTKHE